MILNSRALKKLFSHRLTVIVCVLLALFLFRDFASRVYVGVDSSPVAEETDDLAELVQERSDVLTPYLKHWFDRLEQERLAAEAARRAEEAEDEEPEPEPEPEDTEPEPESEPEPLAGSTELEQVRLRVSAIFIAEPEQESARYVVMAELQDVETGDVSRTVLNQNDTIGDTSFYVARIYSNYIQVASQRTDDTFNIYVFRSQIEQLEAEQEQDPND